MLKTEASQVITYEPDGVTSPRWLGAFAHVNGLTWGFTCPGGADQMSCVLTMDGTFRTDALNPGRVVRVSRGASSVWEGILDEPTPQSGGWAITAHGAGTWGSHFLADTRNYSLDGPVEAAIDRGLRWNDAGITSGYLPPLSPPTNTTRRDAGCILNDGWYTVEDTHAVAADVGSHVAGYAIPVGTKIVSVVNGDSFLMDKPATFPRSKSKRHPDPDKKTKTLKIITKHAGQPQISPFSTDITSWMDQITAPAGLLWSVDRYLNLRVFPLPSTPTRLLVTPDPAARTIANDITSLVLSYQEVVPHKKGKNTSVQDYTEVSSQAGIERHGRIESFLDLSGQSGNANVYTDAQATDVGADILERYKRVSYASAFTVRYGQYLTLGGQPVDLGAEEAGTVVRLLYSDSGCLGGEVTSSPVTFVVGNYAFDEDSITAQVTPLSSFRTDISALPGVMFRNLR